MCPALIALLQAVAAFGQTADVSRPVYSKLEWRSIGPYRGGRVTAVSGVNSQPGVYYFGATGGGVWKSVDAGVNWIPISDGQFGTGSVGAIAVAESDPNVVYVGMGESPIRGNVSHGDGMYKSLDAGRSWSRIGLEDTRHIARVRVHPRNADLVYVAALGHIFAPNEQRGIFRSQDGGKTWQRVLFRNNHTGAIDLAMDPANPRVLYAGFWQVKRTPYSLESGGPGSGLFKSTDGGDTWTEITRNTGLPAGLIGKVGITVSPVSPERVYAIIEAEDGGVFRSDNAGATWTRVNQNRNLRQRAWYYTRIYADPLKLDTLYVLNVGFWRSDDGGRTFRAIPTPHGDNHDLWIAANDSNRMIEGNDGGANVSLDGGRNWTEQDQPTGQFYRVAVDDDFPYNVYGGQQDNTTVRIASRTAGSGIGFQDWWAVGGCESGWVAPWPKDSHIVYAGCYGGYLSRYDHRTRQLRDISVWPDNPMGHGAEGMKYRFQWNFPILFSPHDPNLLYAAANILFKTTNEGQSWEAISPDLTRNDQTKLGPSGGPITKDNTGVEYYSTVFTVAESPLARGLIWAGTDDGLVHVTRDGGQRWENVTPKELPEWIQVNSIEASPHDAASAYVAATLYKSDDFRPYLYKTSDYGRTWKKIVNGIGPQAFTRVVRADPHRRGLLYAGTELGVYVSFNDGESWSSLQLNLPVVPITDLAVQKRDKDLVAATQGRSFWILDDLPVLHQMTDEIQNAGIHLFQPEDVWRFGRSGSRPPAITVGQNPPAGAVVWFWLKNRPKEVTLEFLDAAGKLVRKISTSDKADEESGGGDEEGSRPSPPAPRLQPSAGLNRFVWNLRYPDASTFPGMVLWMGPTTGPMAIPGSYTVRLTVDGTVQSQTFTLRKDPRLDTTPEDYARQLALLLQIRDKVSQTHDAIRRIRDVRKQLNEVAARHNDTAISEAAQSLGHKLTAVEEELYQTRNQSAQDPLNYPIRLNNKLAHLTAVVGSSDHAPTRQSYLVYEDLTRRINLQLRTLDRLLGEDLAAFNKLVRDRNLPAVR